MEPVGTNQVQPVLARYLTRYTIIWTLLVVVAAVFIIQDRMEAHRHEQIQAGQHRLDSLHESLDVTFQQLTALPRALSRQSDVSEFLSHMVVESSATLPESERKALTEHLSRQPAVRQISSVLRETAIDFQVSQIYLTDAYGTIVADSLFETAVNNLGGNRRTRQYFTEALESGSATQFLVGRVTKVPGFYFSARVGDADKPHGLVVVKQESQALQRLMGDATRHLYVTDAQGVVLMSNQSQNILHRIDTPATRNVAEATYQSLYQRVPPLLPWEFDSVRVRGNTVTTVRQGGHRYLVVSTPLTYGHLQVWNLIPTEGESGVITAWGTGMGLVLLMGYAFLAMCDQRAQRIEPLTRGQQELQDMAEALPLTVFRYFQPAQGTGHFTFIGGGLEERLGVSREQLQQDPTWPWRNAERPTMHPPVDTIEYPILRDGRTLWIRCESQTITHPDGSITYHGYWSDVSQRKQVEARLQAIFEHAPFGFMFVNDALVIERANPAAVEIYGGQTEQDLIGLHPNLPPLSPPLESGANPPAEEVLAQNQALGLSTFEWKHVRLNGEPFEASIVAIPFEQDGKIQICAIVHDITARKQAEAATLAGKQAAEAAALAKSRFLANMSHEIRTPMNAVLGMTHLALMDDLPERARNYVDKAHRAAGNLLQILNDVLDVSKIESGKLELEEIDFQLETVISNMADVLGVKAEEKGLELLFTAPPDIPTALIGDPTRLGQILINLGNNAIKFTSQGEVLIGCEVQRQNPREVTLHFWVRDTGIGMSPEQIDRLFQPFTQGDSSTTRQFGGTGLGLTISRQLTELMYGQIWVDSQPGRGSTFHFTARFGIQKQASNRRALMASELQGKRVLLVDDHPAAREVMGEMIRRLGLQVDVANGGEQALALLEQAYKAGQPHQVLITDWKMPGMDGIEFARRALTMPPQHRPCVLLVTAFAREEAIQAAKGLGLSAVITKPITPSTLLDSLVQSLGQDVAPTSNVQNTSKILQKAQRHLAGARVLLVEDQPLNQELACDLLERAGLTVVTAVNGLEALDKLRSDGPFDGVLMDCQMPVMDGYTASQRIRAEAAWSNLPIIAMTASAMAADRERVLQSGMNDHITKPLDLKSMFTILARWITPARPAVGHASTEARGPVLPLTTALDTVDGLARCMGNLDLYRRLLKGFAKTQSQFESEFRAAANDPEQAIQVAHTLKGLAGNIGAKKLLAAANELEQALHNGLDCQLPLKQTLEELPRVLDDIALVVQQNEAVTSQRASQLAQDANLQPYWVRLAELVADNDAHAGDLIQEVLQRWPELHQLTTVCQLKQALEQYDFDRAAECLQQLNPASQG